MQIFHHEYGRPCPDQRPDDADRDPEQGIRRVAFARHVDVLPEPRERVRRHRDLELLVAPAAGG